MPRFALLGRFGLPLAAVGVALALWSTTTWALASPGTAALKRPVDGPGVARAEAITVGIPSVVFGESDGLPRHLAAGEHQVTLAAWLAAGSPASTVSLNATGGTLRGCSAVPLRAAAVTTLHCGLTTDGSALTLLARTTVAGHVFQRAYVHR